MKTKSFNLNSIITKAIIFVAVLLLTLLCFVSLNNEIPAGVTYAEAEDVTFSLTPKDGYQRTCTTYADLMDDQYTLVCSYAKAKECRFTLKANIPANKTLKGKYIVYYSTFDMTAIASNKDYTANSGKLEVYAQNGLNINTTKELVVAVTATDYATYTGVSSITNKDLSEVYTPSDTNANSAEDVGYMSLYFGIKIYKVTYDDEELDLDEVVTPTETKLMGNTQYSRCAYGMLPASHYLPIDMASDTYSIKYYNDVHTNELNNSDYLPEGSTTTRVVNLRDTAVGKVVTADLTKTGLAHYYISGRCKIDGSDVWQDDSYVGIAYENYLDYTDNVYKADLMKSHNVGMVTIEMDGYPDDETIRFDSFKCNKACIWGSYSYGEAEWGECTHQFEKYTTEINTDELTSSVTYQVYRATGNGYGRYYDETVTDVKYHAYRVENPDPAWVGFIGRRVDGGAKRYLYDCVFWTTVRDDTPPTVTGTYVCDTSTLTQDDTIYVQVKFSEPIQYDGEIETGKNVCSLLCSFGAGENTYEFTYQGGFGSDTLVFSYPLKNMPEGAYDQLVVKFLVNGENIADFSSLQPIQIVSYNEATYSNTLPESTKSGGHWTLNNMYDAGSYEVNVYDANGTHSTVKPGVDFINSVDATDYTKFKLTISIDSRTPSITAVTPDSFDRTKTHTATISVEATNSDTQVLDIDCYVSWTDDLTELLEQTDKSIPHPTYYSRQISAKNSKNTRFEITDSRSGTVFLWVKVVSRFGREDERLAGPFYFDIMADDISNIQFTDSTGGNAIDSRSPTKTKFLKFTVEHKDDYRSYSGYNISKTETKYDANNQAYLAEVNYALRRLDLLWATSSPWTSATTTNSVNLFDINSYNTRGLQVLSTETEAYYSLTYQMTNTNLSNALAVNMPTTTTFMTPEETQASTTTTTYKKTNFVTSRTYLIEIGYDVATDSTTGKDTVLYNDFNLSDTDPYNKVYVGLIVTDSLGNIKAVGDSTFREEQDYASTKYAYFDTRNIIQPTVSYNGTYSLTDANGGIASTEVDSDIDLFKVTEPLHLTLTFDESISNLLCASNLESNKITYTIKLTKPYSTLESFTNTKQITIGTTTTDVTQTFNADTGIFVDYPCNDYYTTEDSSGTTTATNSSALHSNEWFTYSLTIKDTGRIDTQSNKIYETRLDIYTKEYNKDTAADMVGFYSLSIELNDYTASVTATKTTQEIEFYLGSSADATENITEIEKGSVFINKVYRLYDSTGSVLKYYYQPSDLTVVAEDYVSGGYLTFSSEAKAYEYIEYMEYQDLYVFQIPNAETATSLNTGQGNYVKAASDINKKASAGEYWIRYKMSTWDVGTTKPTAWVYYYYGPASTVYKTISLSNISVNLRNAISTVTNTILKNAKWEVLTSYDSLDEYGSPYINESWIKYDVESVTKTKSGTEFSSPLSYTGDTDIYDSTVTIDDVEYQLVSTTTFYFDEYTNIYISPVSDTQYAGRYGKVSSYTTDPIKTVINDIYRQFYIQDGVTITDVSTINAPSGAYKILEVSKKGYKTTLVYVDKIAPQLNFEYKVWATDDETGTIVKKTAEQYYASPQEVDHQINAVSFTITGLGSYGAHDSNGATAEIDRLAYIAVYNSIKSEVLYAYTADDLKSQSLTLTDGKYYIEVYDRSGNNYTVPLRLLSTKMNVTVKSIENVYITIDNRDDSDIKSFEVKLNNDTYDTTFAESKMYDQSGTYQIDIVDWYGMTYSQQVTFQRDVPSVTWRYMDNGVSYSNVTKDTLTTVVSQESSDTFTVATSVAVGFVFSGQGDVGVTLGSEVSEEDFNIYTSNLNQVYELKEAKSFTVTFYYIKYPNISSTYKVSLDTTAPQILASYDQYSYEQMEALDVVKQIKQNIKTGGSYLDGDPVDPTRIDYKLLTSTKTYITYGATVDAPVVSLNYSDGSGIKSITIVKDGVTLYSGEYLKSGAYTKYVQLTEDEEDDKTIKYVVIDKIKYKTVAVNYNELSETGTYTITCYDLLNNKSTFTFTNSSTYEVSYNIDGETYSPEYYYVYKTDKDGEYILDEDGNKIVDSKWLFVKYFNEVGEDEESKYSDVEKADKDSVANYVRNAQEYTICQYGNEYQQITLSQDADLLYLLTDYDLSDDNYGKETKYFLGVRYENGIITTFYYQVNINTNEIYKTDDSGNIIYDADDNPIVESTTYTYTASEKYSDPIRTKSESKTDRDYTIYEFEALDMVLTARFRENGQVIFKLSAPTSSERIVTIETKVTSSVASYEPAYFKSKLSLHESNVTVYNEFGAITIGEVGTGECVYTNGSTLTVDTTEVQKEYITSIRISFSDVLSFKEFYYLYTDDATVKAEEMYTGGDGDGYYCIEINNKFGNQKKYYFAVSNSLLVSTKATYVDGWEREYPTTFVGDIYSNLQVEITFKDENVTYTIVKTGDSTYAPTKETYLGSTTLTFKTVGEYYVEISDVFGNGVQRHFVIEKKDLILDSNILYGYNEKALRRTENYTNNKLSIDTKEIVDLSIKYIEIEYSGKSYILYDEISRTDEKVAFDEKNFRECIGEYGDGEYKVIFRDLYGNSASEKVYYRGTPTLSLSRMTTTSQRKEDYLLEDALNESIGFCSNNSLYFTSVSTKYIFTINGETNEIGNGKYKELTFSTNITEGKLEYKIYYLDEYGFEYSFYAKLHRTTVVIQLKDGIQTQTIDGEPVTRDCVAVEFSSTCTCTYTINGGESQLYTVGQNLTKDGTYKFTIEDASGNTASCKVKKDTVVYYQFAGSNGVVLTNGLLSTANKVVFTALNGDDSYVKKAYLNGEEFTSTDFDSYNFTKNGKWDVIVADGIGNEISFMFYIYTHEVNYLDYYEPTNYDFTDIWYSSNEEGNISCNAMIETDDDGYKHFAFKDAGVYTVVLSSKIDGVSTSFSLVVSNEFPEATLDGVEEGGATINDIVLMNTKQGDIIYVYKDGSLIDTYEVSSDGEKYTIDEEGDYKVVVKNIAGNTIEYNFTRKHVANTAGSVLLILLFIAIAIGLFIGLLYRNKSRVDK